MALRASDGRELWRRAVDNDDAQSPNKPAAAGDGLVFVSGIGALHAADGSVAWKITTNHPLLYGAGAVYEIVQLGPNIQIRALRASDGRKLWTSVYLSASDIATRVAGNIAIGAGMLYVGLVIDENDSPAALDALDTASGMLRWSARLPGWPQGVTVANGVVYAGFTSGLFALDGATGAMRWQQSTGSRFLTTRLRPSGTSSSSPRPTIRLAAVSTVASLTTSTRSTHATARSTGACHSPLPGSPLSSA